MADKKSLIDFVEERKQSGELFPLTATFELTLACNLRCCHCYLENCQGSSEELSTEQWQNCIDQTVDLGAYFAAFTGGEILLHPDFLEIARYALKRGIFFGLQTNGTRIDAPMADAIQDIHPTKVDISLYGASADVHDRITGVPGSFKKTVKAIELLRQREIKVGVKTSVISANWDQVPSMRKLAAGLGAWLSADPVIMPGVFGTDENLSHRMNDDEYRAYMVSERWDRVPGKEFEDLAKDSDRPDRRVLCPAAKKRFTISARGEVIPCPIWRHNCGNVKQQDLKSIWLGEEMLRLRQVKFEDLKECTTCETYESCVRCAGFAEMETGDYLACPSESRRMSTILSEIRHKKGKNGYFAE
ncbi:MAG: radical SAM protein [Thermoleophilia bacterium]